MALREYKYEIIAGLLGGVLLVCWFFAPMIAQNIYFSWHNGSEFNSDLAAFGDSYAVFNGLISGLALAAIVTAIWIQAEQLREQRREVARTLENLQRQEEADDLRFTVDSAPLLQKFMLDDLRQHLGERYFLEREFQLDPEETSLGFELAHISENTQPSFGCQGCGGALEMFFNSEVVKEKVGVRLDIPLETYKERALHALQKIYVTDDASQFEEIVSAASDLGEIFQEINLKSNYEFNRLANSQGDFAYDTLRRELKKLIEDIRTKQKVDRIIRFRLLLQESIQRKIDLM